MNIVSYSLSADQCRSPRIFGSPAGLLKDRSRSAVIIIVCCSLSNQIISVNQGELTQSVLGCMGGGRVHGPVLMHT